MRTFSLFSVVWKWLGPRPRVGFTLVETMVHMFLLAILLTAVYSVFVLALRYSQANQAVVDLQDAAQTALDSITGELSQSDIKGVFSTSGAAVSTYSGPWGVIFISANAPESSFGSLPAPTPTGGENSFQIQSTAAPTVSSTPGAPYWQKWVCYYVNPKTGELWRKEEDGGTSGQGGATGLPSATIPTTLNGNALTTPPGVEAAIAAFQSRAQQKSDRRVGFGTVGWNPVTQNLGFFLPVVTSMGSSPTPSILPPSPLGAALPPLIIQTPGMLPSVNGLATIAPMTAPASPSPGPGNYITVSITVAKFVRIKSKNPPPDYAITLTDTVVCRDTVPSDRPCPTNYTY